MCWVAGSIISSTKRLMVQVIFWLIENRTVVCLWYSKLFVLYYKVMRKWKNKLKGFLQRILKEIIKKILGTSDAWSMRQSSQQPRVSYWRLPDFWSQISKQKDGHHLWIRSCSFWMSPIANTRARDWKSGEWKNVFRIQTNRLEKYQIHFTMYCIRLVLQ